MSAIYIACVLGYLRLYQPHQTKNDNNYRTMAIDINIILTNSCVKIFDITKTW